MLVRVIEMRRSARVSSDVSRTEELLLMCMMSFGVRNISEVNEDSA